MPDPTKVKQKRTVVLAPRQIGGQSTPPKLKATPLPTEKAEKKIVDTKTKAPQTKITKLPPHLNYPRSWRDLRNAGISLGGPGSQSLCSASRGYRGFISSIVFVVSGPTTISFSFGNMGASGPMEFGDTDEPRGLTLGLAESPTPFGNGTVVITSTGVGVTVGGWLTFYIEPDEIPS